jgi:hypothetical protein
MQASKICQNKNIVESKTLAVTGKGVIGTVNGKKVARKKKVNGRSEPIYHRV